MKHRVSLFFALALLGSASSAMAQSSSGFSGSTVTGAPWAGDRALGEGSGIQTGRVEWHPGVSGEVGYDSNYLQRADTPAEEDNFGPVVPSMRFRVTPQLSLRTYRPERKPGAVGGTSLPPLVMFDFTGVASYNELVALDGESGEEFRRLRRVTGGAGLVLDFFQGRKWSGQTRTDYSFQAEPSNQGGLGNQFDRHTIGVGAKLVWAPGGGAFRWSLIEYNTRVTIFDDGAFGVYDNGNHSFGTNGYWRFLPKTSVLYDATVGFIRYNSTVINDGEYMQARLGLNGLLTKKLALLGMGGWATSFYRDQTGLVRNYDDFIGRAEAKWFFTADGKLQDGSANVGASAMALGYIRDYNDSYLGDFYRRDRGYLQMSYLIAGRVVTTAEGGVSRITYPDFLFDGITQQSFGETRFDIKGLVEYRPVATVGINLQLLYDQNVSQIVQAAIYEDNLSFNRFRAMLGARWFM